MRQMRFTWATKSPSLFVYFFFKFLQFGQRLAPWQVDSDDTDKLAQGFGRFHTMVAVQNPVVPGDENGLLACVCPVARNPPGFRFVDLLLGLLQLVRGDELQLARRDVVALFCVTGADLGHLEAWDFAEFCLGIFVHLVEEELGVDLLGELLLLPGFLCFSLLLGLVVYLAQGIRVGDAGRCSQLGCGCLVFDEVVESTRWRVLMMPPSREAFLPYAGSEATAYGKDGYTVLVGMVLGLGEPSALVIFQFHFAS